MSAAVAVAVASAINATLVSKLCFIDPSSALLIEAAYCCPFKQKRYHNRGESPLPFCHITIQTQPFGPLVYRLYMVFRGRQPWSPSVSEGTGSDAWNTQS